MALILGEVLEKIVRRELENDNRYDPIAGAVSAALRVAAGQLDLVETGTRPERGAAVAALTDLVGQPTFDVSDVLAAAVRSGCSASAPHGHHRVRSGRR